MEAGIELDQPLRLDIRSFARRFRRWTMTASRRWGQARGNNAQRSVTASKATERQFGTMIRPSMHERVALACRDQDW